MKTPTGDSLFLIKLRIAARDGTVLKEIERKGQKESCGQEN
jgi:hypothetical protein